MRNVSWHGNMSSFRKSSAAILATQRGRGTDITCMKVFCNGP